MVVVELKDLDEILKLVSPYRRVSIFGCEIGSGRCRQGGLKEALKVSSFLKEKGKEVVEVRSLGGTCIVEKVENFNFKETDAVVSLACGAGTQVIAETVDIPVITGVNTLFIGSDRNRETFEEYCIACGECIISETGGICPVARCPKSLINGPCGGAVGGMCEVDSSMPCIWYSVYDRLRITGKSISISSDFRDYGKSVYPRKFRNEL